MLIDFSDHEHYLVRYPYQESVMPYKDPEKRRENARKRGAKWRAKNKEYFKQWAKDHPESGREADRRYKEKNKDDPAYRARRVGYTRKDLYGLTGKEFEAMLEEQRGLCAICGLGEGTPTRKGTPRRWAVDHDHETGRIRGILCGTCNTGLGLLQDSPAIVAAALQYLKERS